MENKYVIFWGYDKDKAPVWEANINIDDEEPINPNDSTVLKFDTQEEVKAFIEEHYTRVVDPEILDMEQAIEIYNEYINK